MSIKSTAETGDIQQMTTHEMFELAEKDPLKLYKDATSHGMEISDYLDVAVKKDGVGSNSLPAFNKLLHRNKLPIRNAGGNKAAPVREWLLPDEEPPLKRSYRRMLWHEALRKEVEDNLNSGLNELEPVRHNMHITPEELTQILKDVDPEVLKAAGSFSLTELLRDGMLRPAIRQANKVKEYPRMVIELSDIAMGETRLNFGGEKALVIDNENKDNRFATARVAEYEEFSRAKLRTEEISHQIYKYGIGVEASYEFIQNSANIGFDQIALYFSHLATYWRMDEVNLGLDTIMSVFSLNALGSPVNEQLGQMTSDTEGKLIATPIGGTGEIPTDRKAQAASRVAVEGINVNAREGHYVSHLGSKTTATEDGTDYILDPYSWRNMQKSFPGYAPPHIRLNQIFSNAHMSTELEMLNLEKTNIPLDRNVGPGLSRVNPLPPLRTRDGFPYGWTERIPNERYLMIDRNWALMYYTRIQSNISETERFILNQSQVWVVSKAFGFRVYDTDGIWLISVTPRPKRKG